MVYFLRIELRRQGIRPGGVAGSGLCPLARFWVDLSTLRSMGRSGKNDAFASHTRTAGPNKRKGLSALRGCRFLKREETLSIPFVIIQARREVACPTSCGKKLLEDFTMRSGIRVWGFRKRAVGSLSWRESTKRRCQGFAKQGGRRETHCGCGPMLAIRLLAQEKTAGVRCRLPAPSGEYLGMSQVDSWADIP
ncbi:hypothetical protein MAMC_01134 [Methylacidimicrobium cyclopophantes]|uniref:Uncharacterized protein n=1 Tax=Methylacidimicrobium cyclopophantes TaxID=1041766 RepID=A0A5E6MDW4_9BACT|nr:hypothetical protein MAMC_01134 [Methylacidimicrobium cyclopophantes]